MGGEREEGGQKTRGRGSHTRQRDSCMGGEDKSSLLHIDYCCSEDDHRRRVNMGVCDLQR